jgi:hypothetical protein
MNFIQDEILSSLSKELNNRHQVDPLICGTYRFPLHTHRRTRLKEKDNLRKRRAKEAYLSSWIDDDHNPIILVVDFIISS